MYETSELELHEYEGEGENFLFEGENFFESEGEGENFFESEGEGENFLGALLGEGENFLGALLGEGENFFENEGEGENFLGALLGESPLSEAMEMELASELLEITNEQELEQFLGKVIRGAAKGVGKFMKSSTGRALGRIAKSVAKKALPVVGGALGSFVAPGVGTAIGSKLGSLAGGLFEVGELESMHESELEFETARRVVRLTAAAARNATKAPRSAPGPVVAKTAFKAAARQHAPGLLRPTPRRRPGGYGSNRRQPVPSRATRGRTPARRTSRGGSSLYTDNTYGGSMEPAYGPSGNYGNPTQGWSDGYGDGWGQQSPRPSARRTGGRWYRRGNRIVIVGV